MTKEVMRVPFEEFSSNLLSYFERVLRDDASIVVESKTGERAVLKPVRLRKKRMKRITKADLDAFRSSAGGWNGLVDVDAFLEINKESRKLNTRTPVDI